MGGETALIACTRGAKTMYDYEAISDNLLSHSYKKSVIMVIKE